jgi:serine/threonine protein kinase
MHHGRLPHARTQSAVVLLCIAFCSPPLPTRVQKWIKSRLRSLIEQCLDRDPAKRPTAQGICASIHRLCSTTTTTTDVYDSSEGTASLF